VGFEVDLTGRRAVVSGASSGIGAEISRAIVACGGSVVMLARREPLLRELEQELGPRALGVPVDVTDLDALSVAIERAADHLGAIDALVAAAGQSMTGSIATGTPERWRELIDLNLTAPLAMVRYAIEHFATRAAATWCSSARRSRSRRSPAPGSTPRRSAASVLRSTSCASSWHRWASTSAT
jgi:NADP-dependent 3-hydroxy acid dehydrogenase YdfG